MKFFLSFLLLITTFLNAEEKDYYVPYKSLAIPVYSPWLKDEVFKEINNKFPENGNELIYVRYIQYILAKNALANCDGGDLIECGVLRGKCLDILASTMDRFDYYNRTLFGVDSFEGLSAPCSYDNEIGKNQSFFKKGDVRGYTLEDIQKRLSYHSSAFELLKGWIPAPFSSLYYCEFCFAHIDVALYEPTKASLEFIYPRMLKGGIILFDDYGFTMCPGARKAIDDFLSNKYETLIPLPSGQAMLIKQ